MSAPEARNDGWLWPVLLVVLLVAAVVTFLGIHLAGATRRPDIAVEAAKAGIQLGVVVVLTTVVTQAFSRAQRERDKRVKRADIEREERRRLNEYRLTVFRDSIAAYNRVKTVRRTLRAVGLSDAASGSLLPSQIDELDAQMRNLNEAELSLERIGREVTAQREMFPGTSGQMVGLVTCLEYLRNLLNVWETSALLTIDHDEAQTRSVQRLEDFLAKRRDREGGDFWPSFDAFEHAMRADLLQAGALGDHSDGHASPPADARIGSVPKT